MIKKKRWCTSCGAVIDADQNLAAAYCDKCGDRIEFSNTNYSEELIREDVYTVARAATRTEHFNKPLVDYLATTRSMPSAALAEAVYFIDKKDYKSAEAVLENICDNTKSERTRTESNTILRCMALLACVKYYLSSKPDNMAKIIAVLENLDNKYADYIHRNPCGEEVGSFAGLCSTLKNNLKVKYDALIEEERKKDVFANTLAKALAREYSESDSYHVPCIDDVISFEPTSTLTNEDHDLLDDMTRNMGWWPDVRDM